VACWFPQSASAKLFSGEYLKQEMAKRSYRDTKGQHEVTWGKYETGNGTREEQLPIFHEYSSPSISGYHKDTAVSDVE